jgi:hypothetical protein
VEKQGLDGIMITTWHHLPDMNMQMPNHLGAAWNGESFEPAGYVTPTLLRKLMRSRVVEGEYLLDLMPNVKLVSPEPTMLNGTFVSRAETGYIQLIVKPPTPDEKD